MTIFKAISSCKPEKVQAYLAENPAAFNERDELYGDQSPLQYALKRKQTAKEVLDDRVAGGKSQKLIDKAQEQVDGIKVIVGLIQSATPKKVTTARNTMFSLAQAQQLLAQLDVSEALEKRDIHADGARKLTGHAERIGSMVNT